MANTTVKVGGLTGMNVGGDKLPAAKRKYRRNRPGNFANYGKPRFPRAKAYPFEWGQLNGS